MLNYHHLTMAPSLLLFAVVAQGYETFHIQCTSPSTTVNFVSSADKRGTTDILFSCLFTLIACTWTVQHLNVPEQREGRDPGWLGDIKWASKRAWTSTKWMLFTVLAPEFLLAKSLADLRVVDSTIAKLRKFAAEDGVPWTRVHSQFANMGGFVLRVGGNTTEPNDAPPMSYSNPYHLVASNILALREAGLLTKLPSITQEEINDKSKSDGLIRAITVVQIVWMMVQIIVRASRNLTISQLEVSVLAFASCAIVLYGLNWEKPKGVQVPYALMTYEGEIPRSFLPLLREQKQPNSAVTLFVESLPVFRVDLGDNQQGGPIPNDVTYFDATLSTDSDVWGLLIGSAIFGAIHLAAWNFVFPTSIERTIWRIASTLCTSIMFVVAGCGAIDEALEKFEISTILTYYFIEVITLLTCFGYVLARLFIVVETFRTLFFLPPSAYIATWASNVPHIA
jgi:hypothetical protein